METSASALQPALPPAARSEKSEAHVPMPMHRSAGQIHPVPETMLHPHSTDSMLPDTEDGAWYPSDTDAPGSDNGFSCLLTVPDPASAENM